MGLKIYICFVLIVVGTTAVFGRRMPARRIQDQPQPRGLWPRAQFEDQPRSDLNKRVGKYYL